MKKAGWLLILVATGLLTVAVIAHAQHTKKLARIGFLSASDPATESVRADAIRLALRERGYIEGQNVAIEYRYAEGKLDRLPELATELVHLKVDIILAATGAVTIRAAKKATQTISIVMMGAGADPIEAGFVESLARPGGNITGLTNLNRDLGGKRLELLKEAVPQIVRVAVFYDPAGPTSVREVKEVLPAAARALRLTIQRWEIRTADDFDRVFAAMGKQRPDGLLLAGARGSMKKFFTLFWLLATAILIYASAADAQQPGKNFRIGFLDVSTASGIAVNVDSFRQELSKLGWIEEKNITIEYRFAEGRNDSLPGLAAELVRLRVDLIVVTVVPAAIALKAATTTIPIVVTSAADPVAAGLIASLARPGANVTGLASLSTELITKRLEVLKDAVPRLSRVGILRLRGVNLGEDLQLKELRPAALTLKLKLEEIDAQADSKGLESAFQSAKQKQVGAIMTTATRPFFAERKRIVELAGKYRMPAVYSQKEYVDEGGLMSYGADYDDLYRKAAHYVDKILKGTKPADLPVQQATKFGFVINLKAANQIGLTVPVRLLERANQVIK